MVADFGGVPLGETGTVLIQIANVGGLPLTVIQLSVDDPQFTVNSQGPFTFPPGNFWAVGVSFTPHTPGPADGVLTIETDDPNQPIVDVPLTGVGQAGQIELQPTRLDFGPVEVDRRETSTIVIRNAGNVDLTVRVAPDTGPAFTVDVPGQFTLSPGAAREITVTFAPLMEGGATGQVIVRSDDANQPVIPVVLEGVGILRRVGFEVAVQPTDIRIVPDTAAPVTYTFQETENQDIVIRSAASYLELPDGRRVDLVADPFERRLAAGEVGSLDDVVLMPEGVLDGLPPGDIRFVRTFTGTSDGRETTAEAIVELIPSGSFGADLAVTTVAVEFPTAGTTVPLEAPLHARALIFGEGSGSVLGAWIVNGIAVESFSVDLTGGRVVEVETVISLPTGIVGLHEVTVEITDPATLRSPAVPYLVTTRSLERLRWTLEEGFRAYLRQGVAPRWSWTPKAAVVAYDVLVDGESIGRTRWPAWTLTTDVTATLPAGPHTLEIIARHGETDDAEAAPADRLVSRFEVLDTPLRLDSGCESPEACTWTGPGGDGLFRVEVRDQSTGDVAYRRITRLSQMRIDEVRAIIGTRAAYTWKVEALNDYGETIGRSDPLDLPVVPR